jgi:hypothetical protein
MYYVYFAKQKISQKWKSKSKEWKIIEILLLGLSGPGSSAGYKM